MSIAEIKEEIKSLEVSELDEVAALILQLRRGKDPERKGQLTDLIDGDDWVAWKRED
jgi:hypothetical protein